MKRMIATMTLSKRHVGLYTCIIAPKTLFSLSNDNDNITITVKIINGYKNNGWTKSDNDDYNIDDLKITTTKQRRQQ